MNCAEFDARLDAYTDGELDALHANECETHLAECSRCTAALQSRTKLRASLQSANLAYPAPESLRQDLTARLAPPPRALRFWRAAAIAAMLLLTLSLITQFLLRPSTPTQPTLAQEAISSHIRSLMGGGAVHLADVISTDQHTVKPWFAGKLDFSPPVNDFAADGFPLAGGRLDYLHNHPVAALIYHRRAHIINLFIWPNTDPTEKIPDQSTQNGYSTRHWTQNQMHFLAVTDAAPAELTQLAALSQR